MSRKVRNTYERTFMTAAVALKQLRRVVKLLEKENSQLKKDCESKLEYQR